MSKPKCIPVIFYHHVSPYLDIHPSVFEKQIEYLSLKGYSAITLYELRNFMLYGAINVSKPVVITFDDGYYDNYAFAYPILRKFNFKGTIFVITSRIKDKRECKVDFENESYNNKNNPDNFITWEEAKEMVESGVIDIQSHTHLHYRDGKSWEKVADMDIKQDLILSKKMIESKTKKTCDFICWPWGRYDEYMIEMAKSAGYKGCLTTKTGSNFFGGDVYRINRINIWKNDERWFKNRMKIYSNAFLSRFYSGFYGIDRKIKRILKIL
ncbi:MAG: polysaccharide deacetylase family protein [Elusimicrobiota bacterium]